MGDCSFLWRVLNIHPSGVLTALVFWLLHGWCHVKLLLPWRVLCTPCKSDYAVTSCKATHIGCICHLHFWQNGLDLLRAAVVTRWWNGYWKKTWHGNLTLEKKMLLAGLESATFRSQTSPVLYPLKYSRSLFHGIFQWGSKAHCVMETHFFGLTSCV